MNISSIIVSAQPGRASAVSSALARTAGVEIHGATEDGRLIVTIETEGDHETVGIFDQINAMTGVMSVSMVYHQFESDPDREV